MRGALLRKHADVEPSGKPNVARKMGNGEVWGLDPVLVDPSRTFPSIREELELDEPWN